MHALKHKQDVTLSWYALRLYTLVSKFNLLLEYPHCTIWFFDCGLGQYSAICTHLAVPTASPCWLNKSLPVVQCGKVIGWAWASPTLVCSMATEYLRLYGKASAIVRHWNWMSKGRSGFSDLRVMSNGKLSHLTENWVFCEHIKHKPDSQCRGTGLIKHFVEAFHIQSVHHALDLVVNKGFTYRSLGLILSLQELQKPFASSWHNFV